MSLVTISDLQYMAQDRLADMIRAKHDSLAIIDVRGDDHVGGHITGSLNVPSHTHDYSMPELVRNLQTKDIVVFYCALSQQRGPRAALAYLREKQAKQTRKGLAVSQEDSNENDKPEQQIYVLEGGFSKWQEAYVLFLRPRTRILKDYLRYGSDKELTAEYVKDLWEFAD